MDCCACLVAPGRCVPPLPAPSTPVRPKRRGEPTAKSAVALDPSRAVKARVTDTFSRGWSPLLDTCSWASTWHPSRRTQQAAEGAGCRQEGRGKAGSEPVSVLVHERTFCHCCSEVLGQAHQAPWIARQQHGLSFPSRGLRKGFFLVHSFVKLALRGTEPGPGLPTLSDPQLESG